MNNDLEQFSDLDLEGMAHGNNPVANAYRELLAFRLAAKRSSLTIDFSNMSQAEIDDTIERLGNTGGGHITASTKHTANSPAIPDGFTEIQLIKAMTWINRVRRENQNMKEAKTCAELILRFLPAAPKPEIK